MIGYNNDYQSKKLGEILVEMKAVTESQVFDALIISKKEHSLIGSTMVKQGMITLDQLKIALKAQLGYDAVTEEQISLINRDVISVLPEDFIPRTSLSLSAISSTFLPCTSNLPLVYKTA